jgi:hypothetical protein
MRGNRTGTSPVCASSGVAIVVAAAECLASMNFPYSVYPYTEVVALVVEVGWSPTNRLIQVESPRIFRTYVVYSVLSTKIHTEPLFTDLIFKFRGIRFSRAQKHEQI